MNGISLTDFSENKIGDCIIRGVSMSAPAQLWVALYTVTPNEAGVGTEISTSGTGYARKQITEPRTGSFAVFAGGSSQSLILIDFGTATTAWGSLNGLALLDASTAGNMWLYGTLTGAPIVVNAGQPVKIPIGSLTVAFD
jgi:hypothetical protein